MQAKAANYSEIAKSGKFQTLLKRKRQFILPLSLFYFAFYFLLPILTSYSKVLNHSAIGPISWAWVFAFAQFIMTWVLCIVYSKKAARFDSMVQDIRKELGQRF
jgi:uncharacterized membrane protein (DUF485 family)